MTMPIVMCRECRDHAYELIDAGKVNDGSWSFDSADGAKLLGPKGKHLSEYRKWHLGEDSAVDPDDAKRHKYPIGKDGELYTRALKAIRSAAAKAGHQEVHAAAGKILQYSRGDQGDDAGGDDGPDPEPDADPDDVRQWDPRDLERRILSSAELRVAETGKPRISGYAAVFNILSDDLGGFREKILPDRALVGVDCRALVNHDQNLILGRTKSGTCRLASDETGLRMDVDPPDTELSKHYCEAIRRGDLSQCSFSFTVDVDEWDYSVNPMIRTIHRVRELFDVSIVAYPAYPDTTVALRSLERARRSASPVPVPIPGPRGLGLLELRLAFTR